jgi:phage portal protein BeeE
MNVPAVRVTMDQFGSKTYTVTSSTGEPLPGKTFSSADVIDVPFMLATNMVNVMSPITIGEKALQLALAMQDYGSTFFAGGGVPPLALEGPIPQGPDALKRRRRRERAIKDAKDSGKPFFSMPPDHKLTQIGYDPAKGQMTEAGGSKTRKSRGSSAFRPFSSRICRNSPIRTPSSRTCSSSSTRSATGAARSSRSATSSCSGR